MAFDFPDGPAINTVFLDVATGKSYTYDGEKWQAVAGTGGDAPPAGDFLPLTGGALSGPLEFSVATNIDFKVGPSSIHFRNSVGAHQWSFGSTDANFSFINQGVRTVFTIAQGTGVVNFELRPTVAGAPIVLQAALDTALARIAALEARLTKAKL